jgi:hypothetical protein
VGRGGASRRVDLFPACSVAIRLVFVVVMVGISVKLWLGSCFRNRLGAGLFLAFDDEVGVPFCLSKVWCRVACRGPVSAIEFV